MEVGVIGVGTMGRNHVRVFSELKDVDRLYVHDLNSRAAESAAAACGAVPCSSAEGLLEHVDAVSICVPTPHHHAVALEAFKRGVHTLIEKPLCASTVEGADLAAAIPEHLVVGIGHIERFNPIVEEIRRINRNPLYVELKRHNPASARVTGTSVVEDLMIHDIDIVFHRLFDGPYQLSSVGNNDFCSALLKFGPTPVYLSASRKASKKIRMIYVEDEECSVEGDFMTQEIYVYRKPEKYSLRDGRYIQENIIEKVLVNKVEPLRLELETFIQCIRRGTEFPVTPQQALHNLRVCEEIRAANFGIRDAAAAASALG